MPESWTSELRLNFFPQGIQSIDIHSYCYLAHIIMYLQEVYLQGITRSDFCSSHGCEVVLPESARRFSIPHYILVSIRFFSRQDEAANLLLSNITPPRYPNTGAPIMTTEGLPHCLVVKITRDKTNKHGPGISTYNSKNIMDKRDQTSLNIENSVDPVSSNLDIFGSVRSS